MLNIFSGCSGLTSIDIPNSVTSIGKEAFYGCSSLTAVHISDIVAWCGIQFDNSWANPLYKAHHLYLNGVEVKDLIIPSRVTSIGNYAFSGCSGLTSVTIPKGVTNIGTEAFYNCSGLTSVTIPEGVTSIGTEAFYKCSGLTSVTIPNSVKSIGNSAFFGCSKLKEVHSEIKDPFDIDSGVFQYQLWNDAQQSIYTDFTNATLYVPKGTKSKYQAKEGWKSFKTIKEEGEPETVDPTAITISPSSKTINVGESFQASYTLTPSNATTTVTWSSDDTNIATVSSSGVVKGIKAGSTYINVKTANGKKDWFKVTVEESPKLQLSATPSGGEVEKGTIVNLVAKADGSTVSADVYYTTNGTTPTKSSTKYTSSGIVINSDRTIKAIAYKDGYETSDVLTAKYTIKEEPTPTNNEVSQVEAGYFHSLIIDKNGVLWACGDNFFGQLGDGTTTNRTTPVKVMSDVKSMSAGWSHSLILKDDGSLWACGGNWNGQLGDGTTTDRKSPVKVMSDVKSMSAGTDYSLILKNDGSLWACGSNGCGQLGDGSTEDRKVLVKVMSDVQSMSAGNSHSLILKNDGSIWACGDNEYGQLGDGTNIDRHTPVKIMDGVNSAGIDGVLMDKPATDNSVFSLSGQRLSAPRKGLNIIGGKKVMVNPTLTQ